jgi:hypothetical protein
MLMGKEKLLPILAMTILLVGIFSTLFVHASQINKDTIIINGEEYTIDQLFLFGTTKSIQTDEGEKNGVSLESLITLTSVECSTCHEYTIKAKDGYQQTVPWNIMKTGVLTKEGRVFFPDTAHSFWVRDVIEIEVK